MKTMAEQIYARQYNHFEKVLQALGTHDLERARHALTELSSALDSQAEGPEHIQTSFFVKALEKRLSGNVDIEENLYLLPDQGQQIQMFNFMAQKFPVVRFAQELVNQQYLEVLNGQPDVTLWDIGIGNGQQMVRLIESLIRLGQPPRTLEVLGLDPSAASLTQAEQALATLCEQAGIRFQFDGFAKTVESLDAADWEKIERILRPKQGRWVANASFALHHIAPVAERTRFFAKLRALKPVLFCLIEPYADFLEPALKTRFKNAWHHYGLAFWAIDQIDAPLENRNLLKSVFFGREIIDVIARDTGRIEQFETGEMWAQRLRDSQFLSTSLTVNESVIPGFESIRIQPYETYTGLMAQEHPVISILRARCVEA
jgi:hypothetical protein